MTIYYIEPKPEYFNSHRWFVDDDGLEEVKKHYAKQYDSEYFPKRFIVKKADIVGIDFGGMCRIDEPTVSVMVDGVEFEIVKMHMNVFKSLLLDHTYDKNNGMLQVKIWLRNHIYSASTRQKILDAINSIPDEVNLN